MLNIQYIREVGPVKWATRYGWLQFRKRVLRSDGRMRLPTGGELILPRNSRSATEVYVTNADVDWGAEELFARFADRTRDFVDVGAHIGYYSAYLAPLVRRCFAFEPDPQNLDALRANAALAANIEVLDVAVSSATGFAQLRNDLDSAAATIEPGSGGTLTVPMTTIDRFAGAAHDIDIGLIKIDVEGHDFEVLLGASETLAKHRPLVLAECTDRRLDGICEELGYAIFAFVRADARAAKLERFTAATLQLAQTKMTFLVPDHLASRFEDFACRRNAN